MLIDLSNTAIYLLIPLKHYVKLTVIARQDFLTITVRNLYEFVFHFSQIQRGSHEVLWTREQLYPLCHVLTNQLGTKNFLLIDE